MHVYAGGLLIGWRYTTNTDETERYDAQGRLVSITNRQWLTQTLTYDAQGRLATVTDPAGRTLGFAYDEAQRLETLTDPAGGSIPTATMGTATSRASAIPTLPPPIRTTILSGCTTTRIRAFPIT